MIETGDIEQHFISELFAALEDWIKRREANINCSLATKFNRLCLPERLEISFDTHGIVD